MEYTVHPFPLDNTSSPPSHRSLCPSAITLYFLPPVYALLFLTALLGNALSLWVFFGCISTISPIHVYLSHLSISNMLLCLTTPFLAAYYAQGSVWMLTDFLCQLVLHTITPVLHINIYVSLMILTSVALSRFASLIQHTHASRPSICKALLPRGFFACLTRTASARIVCATTWLVAAGGIVPVTVYYSVKEAVATGHEVVCYNPEVELGGSLSTTLAWAVIAIFYVFYLLVLLSYLIVLKHIRRSRRNTNITASQNLLGRVLRNIVIIQVVLSVCLLPYHIFKPIFIILAHGQHQPTFSPGPNNCHPFSTIVEVKNCLLFLAALRSSTDPLMYFMLDKTFRHHTRRLLRCNRENPSPPMCQSVTGRASQRAGQLGDGAMATAVVDLCD